MLKLTKWGGLSAPPLFINLAVFVLLMATVFILPNAERVREVRLYYFEWAMFLALGSFIMTISVPVGLMALFTGLHMGIFGIATEHLALLFNCAVFFLVIYGLHRMYGERFTNIIYNTIAVVALLCFAWQLMQAAGFFILIVPLPGYEDQLPGLMSNTNETAALYAICLPVFFRRKWAWFIPAIITGLFISRGLGGILAAGVVSFLACLRSAPSKKTAIFAVIAAVLYFAVYVKGVDSLFVSNVIYGENNRGRIWTETVRLSMFKPVLGWGIGQFKYVFPLITSPEVLPESDRQMLFAGLRDKEGMVSAYQNLKGSGYVSPFTIPSVEAHNEYLETLFNFGITGLLILVGGLIYILKGAWNTTDRLPSLGLLASCLCALVYFNWHIIPTAIITVVYLGLVTSMVKSESVYGST